MKHYDLQVMNKFPRIPTIELVLKNENETHTFASWKDLIDWCLDELENEIYKEYRIADSDEKRGYEDHNEWFKDLHNDYVDQFLFDHGWNLVRRAT